jgi:hypothetical protein
MVDINEQEAEAYYDEHGQRDPRTRVTSLITGRRFSPDGRHALAARNRRRVGQAQSYLERLAGFGKSQAHGGSQQEAFTIRSVFETAALGTGIPVVRPGDLGVILDRHQAFQPAGKDDLVKLKAGSEAHPFLDHRRGVVYKIFAKFSDGGIAKQLRALQENGEWTIDNEASNEANTLDKLAFLSEIGGLPTEIVGITPNGAWIVMQPEAQKVSLEDFHAARAQAVANVGGITIHHPGLEDVRVVWHRSQAWLIGDLHSKNVMIDAEGHARIMDALILPVPPALAEDLPAVRQTIADARQVSGADTSNETQGLLFSPD